VKKTKTDGLKVILCLGCRKLPIARVTPAGKKKQLRPKKRRLKRRWNPKNKKVKCYKENGG
jgi:hypothetical protein